MQTRDRSFLPSEIEPGAPVSIDFRVLSDDSVHTVVAGLLGDVRDLKAEVHRLRRALASTSREDLTTEQCLGFTG